MADLVRLTAIDKKYPGVHALKAVDFDLRAGEVHALMGENGAGKSTLMRCLSGVIRPDSGTIQIDGKPVRFNGPAEALRHGISIIHQELMLMKHLTVAQNIFIGREPKNRFGILKEGDLAEKIREIFARMNVQIDPAAPVEGMSVANQQMIEIAKALSLEARVLIMDEPTAALNTPEIAALFTIIKELKAQGVGIVYISHRMDEIRQISDRITVMRDGALVGTVSAADTPISKIISMMVGRELTGTHATIPTVADAPVALEVRGLRRGRAVRDVSFSLRKGEILGFAGLMGAGRTEMARLIFGADPREGGTICVAGRETSIKTPHDAVEAGIGYLSEDRKYHGLALGLDVRTNIGLASMRAFANAFGWIREQALAVVSKDYIARLGIRTPSDQQEVRLLSGGNQQKVVIAKWLLRNCDILIFDEPTRGIDVGAKAEIYALLHDLAMSGKAIIVISSELPEILRVAHRIAVMCEGRLTGFLPGTATQEDIMALATRCETGQARHKAERNGHEQDQGHAA